jgi:hypothetical protein
VDDLSRDLSRVRQGLNRVVEIWGYHGPLQKGFHVLLLLQMGLAVRVFGLLHYIRQALGCDTATVEFEGV